MSVSLELPLFSDITNNDSSSFFEMNKLFEIPDFPQEEEKKDTEQPQPLPMPIDSNLPIRLDSEFILPELPNDIPINIPSEIPIDASASNAPVLPPEIPNFNLYSGNSDDFKQSPKTKESKKKSDPLVELYSSLLQGDTVEQKQRIKETTITNIESDGIQGFQICPQKEHNLTSTRKTILREEPRRKKVEKRKGRPKRKREAAKKKQTTIPKRKRRKIKILDMPL